MELTRKRLMVIFAALVVGLIFASACFILLLSHRRSAPSKYLDKNMGESDLLNVDKSSKTDGADSPKSCPAKKINQIESLDDKDKLLVQNESQIALDGHFSGFLPLIYDVQLKLTNFDTFRADVVILVKSVKATATVILNFDLQALTVNPKNIRLKMLKPGANESGLVADLSNIENIEREICLNRTLRSVKKDSLLIMGLPEILPPDRLFLLEIQNYSGRVFDDEDSYQWPVGSEGLRRTFKTLPSAALSTLFQMRLARTVLPCFDHPSLKANFSVCIEHSANTVALSNMMISKKKKKNSSVEVDCFKATPKIPTYVLTFSILENFTAMKDFKESTFVELYFPADEPVSRFMWESDYVGRILTYIKKTFDLTPNINRFAFLNLRPSAFWGIENYGLISLDANELMDNTKELGRSILVHEIVHQWLGNDATISHWDEICLQEGLTAYLEGSISGDLNFTAPLKKTVAAKVIQMFSNGRGIVAPIRKFNVTQDIADHCFGYPFAVFYMMRKAYGKDLLISFLKRLLKEHHFGNANFTQWIKILDEIRPASPNNTFSAGQFLHRWFSVHGNPISYVRVKGDKIDIIQKAAYEREGRTSEMRQYVANISTVRPIPYGILMESGGSKEQKIMVDSANFTWKFNSTNPKWIVVDPAGVTPTRVIYEPEIYAGIIDCVKVQPNCPIGAERFKQIFNDLCFAFREEAIFLNDDEKTAPNLNVTAWDRVLASVYRMSQENLIDRHPYCSCCFKPKGLLANDGRGFNSCKEKWNKNCRFMELMILIGRNYTIP